jgi:hypothetical protein
VLPESTACDKVSHLQENATVDALKRFLHEVTRSLSPHQEGFADVHDPELQSLIDSTNLIARRANRCRRIALALPVT